MNPYYTDLKNVIHPLTAITSFVRTNSASWEESGEMRWKRYGVVVSLSAGKLPSASDPFVHYVLDNSAATFGIILPDELLQGNVIRLENTSTSSVNVSTVNPMAGPFATPNLFTILSAGQTVTYLYSITNPLFLNGSGGSGGLIPTYTAIPAERHTTDSIINFRDSTLQTVTGFLSTNNINLSGLTITSNISSNNLRTSFNQGSATGNYSFAVGIGRAFGDYSHAEGLLTQAIGGYSHAEGTFTRAIGTASHTEGSGTLASGENSHAEGNSTQAIGGYSHAEGQNTQAIGLGSHAEGIGTFALGSGSHAEGFGTIGGYKYIFTNYTSSTNLFTFASNITSHYGFSITPVNTTIGGYVFAFDGPKFFTCVLAARNSTTGAISARNFSTSLSDSTVGWIVLPGGQNSHAEGNLTVASGWHSHAEGNSTQALGTGSHAEGTDTQAIGGYSHAEGNLTYAEGSLSHAEGYLTVARGGVSHAAGTKATAIQDYTYIWSDGNLGTLSQNVSTTRSGQYMVSASGGTFIPGNIGIGTDNNNNALTVTGNVSAVGTSVFTTNLSTTPVVIRQLSQKDLNTLGGNILEVIGGYAGGFLTAFLVTSSYSIQEGINSSAPGNFSHAEGRGTIASGECSHAEGFGTQAIGGNSHAEGTNTSSLGLACHAEGFLTRAIGGYSHAEGFNTFAVNRYSHTEGEYTIGGYKRPFQNFVAGTSLFTFASDITGAYGLANLSTGTVIGGYYMSGFGNQYFTCEVVNRNSITGAISARNFSAPMFNSSVGWLAVPGPNSGTAHAEGSNTIASGYASHAEGNGTVAEGNQSHAEGNGCQAFGDGSHAEGNYTLALGGGSHAEGENTMAAGNASHAGGWGATAVQDYTYIWSDGNLATNSVNVSSTREGQYMIDASGGVYIPGKVGIGTDDINNALTVVGDISATGTIFSQNTLTTSICAMSGDSITPFRMQFTNGLLTSIEF